MIKGIICPNIGRGGNCGKPHTDLERCANAVSKDSPTASPFTVECQRSMNKTPHGVAT